MNPMTVMRSMVLAMLSQHAVRGTCHRPKTARVLYLNDIFIHVSQICTKNANGTRAHTRGTSCSWQCNSPCAWVILCGCSGY